MFLYLNFLEEKNNDTEQVARVIVRKSTIRTKLPRRLSYKC